jgi:hypothetical protein
MNDTLAIQKKGLTVEECLNIELLDRALQAQTAQLIKVLTKA